MDTPKNKKRTSILKKRPSTFERNDSPEQEATTTMNLKKGIMFSQKKSVKEFVHCDDNPTIWGNSYETSLTKSEGSSNGSTAITSKLSLNESSCNLTSVDMEISTNDKIEIDDAEKENAVHFVSHCSTVNESSSKLQRTSSLSGSNSDNSSNAANYSLDWNADERKRVKGYKVAESLNLTNLEVPNEDKIVRSPKKTIYVDEKQNMTVVVHEKIEMRKSQSDQSFCENITINMNEIEKRQVVSGRKTDHRLLGMDITIEESEKEKVLFKKPPILPIPQPFKFLPKHLIKQNIKTQFSSPPIKTPQKNDEKRVIDQYMDFITSDTPTKKLCHEMCGTTKKHGITPLQTEPITKIPKESSSSKIVDYRKSSDILRDAGLELTPVSSKTSFELEEDRKRRTILEADISLDELEIPSKMVPLKDSRKTLFDGEMDESREASSPVFDLDHDQDLLTHTATVSGTKNMTLVNVVNIPEVEKRQTINEHDLTFANSFNPGSTMANNMTMDGTGMSETTNELNRKASRLLKDPMSEVTGVSGNYSSRYLRDEDLNSTEPSKFHTPSIADVSMDLDLPTSKRPDSRATNIVRVLSTDNLDISGITYSRNASATEESSQNIRLKGRETIYSTEDMVINEEEKDPEIEAPKSQMANNRNTIFDADITIEKNDKHHQRSEPWNHRGTIYMHSNIDIASPAANSMSQQKCRKIIQFGNETENTDIKPTPTVSNRKRFTILEPRDITPDTEIIKKSRSESEEKDQKSKRFTVFDESPMKVSISPHTSNQANATASKAENQKRFTIYENSDITTDTEIKSQAESIKSASKNKKRFTTFNNSPMNETVYSSQKGRIEINEANNSRSTVIEDDNIQIESEPEILGSNSISQRDLLTVYNNDIDIENSIVKGLEKVPSSRATTFENEIEIDDENVAKTPAKDFSMVNDSKEKLENIMDISDMDKTLTEENCHDNHLKLAIRETIHEQVEIEECLNNSKHRVTTYTEDVEIERQYIEISTSKSAKRFTIHEDHHMETEDAKETTTTEPEDRTECSLLRRASESVYPSISIHELKEESFAKNESTITNIICCPPPGFDDDVLPKVNHTFNVNSTQVSLIIPPSQNSFVVESDRSIEMSAEHEVVVAKKSFMNITETEFSRYLEDESNPCIENVSSVGSSRRSSVNSSQYRRALQEYVNITLNQSMMNTIQSNNTTISNESPTVPAAFKAQLLETPVDYASKFQSLMVKIEKNDSKPQKSDLDEFLEKLNIEPVKIPNFPSLEPGFLEREAAKAKETVEKFLIERTEQKQREAKAQLPEIPSYSFLIKNKLESIDEEIGKLKFNRSLIIAPIFPEQKDFDFLLENKFKVEKRLQQWSTDFVWAYKNNYKFHHKKLPALKLNFNVQNPSGNLNKSTIPIYFKQVLLYINPNYRGDLSLRMQLLIREFRKNIGGVDNFVSMCKSSVELFDFLHYYETMVEASVCTVNKLFEIVNEYNAVIEKTSETSLDIVTMHFSKANFEICEVSINLRGYIDDITMNNVHVSCSTNIRRQMQPKSSLADLRGLMLLETILFDTEKFIHENTSQYSID